MQKYWPERRCHGKDNIWYAINQVTQEEVILKYFPMSSSDEYKVSREAYTMRYLHNEDPKHFLKMYDYMEDNNEDQYMIAMEKADCSLEDIVNERGSLSEEEAAPILREILYALQIMHKNNFIHRDLKLSNILLSSRDDLTSIKIIDFGETLDRNDDYHITGVVGTLHYMAPEILKKKKYGKAVDIWAFGVIAYRLLTGYFPYMIEGENHNKQLKAILNNSVSYLKTDDKRLSIKAIDFINCILDPEPSDRIGIQTALDHPFLDPYFEGEFVPYKPIPKFSKKMSKENMKEGRPMNMKDLFSKAVKMTKKQDIVGESEKIIKTLFTKDEKNKSQETEPDKIIVTEETDFNNNNGNGIAHSKPSVQPNHNNNPISYSHTTYQSSPYMNGSQTINRNFRTKHQDNNIPEYLNITLGRNNNRHNPYDNQHQTSGNIDNLDINYSPSYSPSNINYSNNGNGNSYEPQINHSPSYAPSNNYSNYNNYNDYSSNENNQIKYSKTYAPQSINKTGPNQINYSKTLAPPKLPKTAGNSIDAYQPPDNYDINKNSYSSNNNNYSNNLDVPKPPKTAGNSIDAYSPQNINNDNSNLSVPQKLPKTAGNTIYTYEEFENVVNNYNGNMSNTTRHNRAYSDSIHQVNNTEEYYQNYGTLPLNRNKYNDNNNSNRNYDNNNNGGLSQFNAKYGGEIGKSNTYSHGTRPKEYHSSSKNGQYSSKPLDDSQRRYNHRKTSSSGSNTRYDYDSDTLQNHHRKTNSGSDPRYDSLDDSQNRHKKTPSSGSNPEYSKMDKSSPRMDVPVLKISPLANASTTNSSYNPKMDNYNKQYNSKKPSPLANAATIKTSNSVDEKYKLSQKNESSDGLKENSKQENNSYFNNANMLNSSSKGKNTDNNEEIKKSKSKIKNLMDIKLKINVPKKMPKVITIDTNHPARNSSLLKTKK